MNIHVQFSHVLNTRFRNAEALFQNAQTPSFQKSLKDPKDRLKAEQGGEGGAGGSGGSGGGLVLGPGGGLVLSPQRRSFNTGCQMLTAPTHPTQANEGKDGDGGGRMREIRLD